jgi:hypothetical protein
VNYLDRAATRRTAGGPREPRVRPGGLSFFGKVDGRDQGVRGLRALAPLSETMHPSEGNRDDGLQHRGEPPWGLTLARVAVAKFAGGESTESKSVGGVPRVSPGTASALSK